MLLAGLGAVWDSAPRVVFCSLWEDDPNAPSHTHTHTTAVVYWYDASNPYHNSKHAADCVHGVTALLAMPTVTPLVGDLELYASLLAAAVHDVAHTGQNNMYHTNVGTDLSLWYSDKSCLERFHLAVAFALMKNPLRCVSVCVSGGGACDYCKRECDSVRVCS